VLGAFAHRWSLIDPLSRAVFLLPVASPPLQLVQAVLIQIIVVITEVVVDAARRRGQALGLPK
jgi:hypothetical protein